LQGVALKYDADSFFQVNVPVFNLALASMKQYAEEDDMVDMYAGVGSIGLSLAQKAVDLVESDPATSAMAVLNAKNSGLKASVLVVPSEKALDYITTDKPIIFDPPRAGLHTHILDKILEARPPKIAYLSCNPATQARDIEKLQLAYKIIHFEVFNFFPRTPHIESLAILEGI
jgi:23S rRNA (uracil1939-C5)-methyltransferase